MRIVIKKEACIGCEICVNTCPEVFMEWGLYMRADFEVKEPGRFKALIEKAIENCPGSRHFHGHSGEERGRWQGMNGPAASKASFIARGPCHHGPLP